MDFRGFSNSDLLARMGKLVQTERKIMHLVLQCIAELDSRKLYLEKAYSSLFDFLVNEYGYSPSSAIRRIEGARLLREVPEVAVKIESGAVNLSQLSQIQQASRQVKKIDGRLVGAEEKLFLLNKIENTNQETTERIIAQELSVELPKYSRQVKHKDESVTVTLTFTKEELENLKTVSDLVSHAVPEKDLKKVISYLVKKEIKARLCSKSSRKVDDEAISLPTVVRNADVSKKVTKRNTSGSYVQKSTRIPIKVSVRKTVSRQANTCGFRDPQTGRVCESKRFLQIDHKQSVGIGGGNEIENLQVLCAAHNRYKYGVEVKERFGEI